MKLKINELKPNQDNPRIIKEGKFKKLVKSIKEFPEMLEFRPIVVDENMTILGGNMRYKACVEAGIKEVYVKIAKDLTKEQKREFIIKDNLSFGEWDWDIIANEWSVEPLETWSLDLPLFEENKYTKNIEAPSYKPTDIKPEIYQLFDETKFLELIEKIKKSNVDNEIKDFLIKSAYRHIVFNYENIAEFYTHNDKEVQELMEESALVIIDLNKAIKNGFVQMTEYLMNIQQEDE